MEADGSVLVKRALEDGYEELKVPTPCVLTAIKDLNTPRYMSIRGILRAGQAEIKVWDADAIGVDKTVVGLKASPTNVFRSFYAQSPKGQGELQSRGISPKELAGNLLADLKAKHII